MTYPNDFIAEVETDRALGVGLAAVLVELEDGGAVHLLPQRHPPPLQRLRHQQLVRVGALHHVALLGQLEAAAAVAVQLVARVALEHVRRQVGVSRQLRQLAKRAGPVAVLPDDEVPIAGVLPKTFARERTARLLEWRVGGALVSRKARAVKVVGGKEQQVALRVVGDDGALLVDGRLVVQGRHQLGSGLRSKRDNY